jgi:hypothetical protein
MILPSTLSEKTRMTTTSDSSFRLTILLAILYTQMAVVSAELLVSQTNRHCWRESESLFGLCKRGMTMALSSNVFPHPGHSDHHERKVCQPGQDCLLLLIQLLEDFKRV